MFRGRSYLCRLHVTIDPDADYLVFGLTVSSNHAQAVWMRSLVHLRPRRYDQCVQPDCAYPTNQFLDCDGNRINDTDGDGVCDELEIAGCTDPAANNYNPFATDDDGSCIIQVGGCTLPFACNYDPAA